MEKPSLNNPEIFPDDTILFQHLGEKVKPVYDSMIQQIIRDYPDISIQWKYYLDGKSWLCKTSLKKTTLFWLSIWDKFYKVTFYFNDKTSVGVGDLPVSEILKNNFKEHKSSGKIKPLTVEVKDKTHLSDLFVLLEYKVNLK